MTIEIKRCGRRWHVVGSSTYLVRDCLRDEGCRWDPVSKVWWTGSARVADRISGLAAKLVARATAVDAGKLPAPPPPRRRADDRQRDYDPPGPCGYPDCSYDHCDECDGWGVRGRR